MEAEARGRAFAEALGGSDRSWLIALVGVPPLCCRCATRQLTKLGVLRTTTPQLSHGCVRRPPGRRVGAA